MEISLSVCCRRESTRPYGNCRELREHGRTGWRSKNSRKQLNVSPLFHPHELYMHYPEGGFSRANPTRVKTGDRKDPSDNPILLALPCRKLTVRAVLPHRLARFPGLSLPARPGTPSSLSSLGHSSIADYRDAGQTDNELVPPGRTTRALPRSTEFRVPKFDNFRLRARVLVIGIRMNVP